MYFTGLQNTVFTPTQRQTHTQLCPGLSVCLQTLLNCLVRFLQLHEMHGSARFPRDCFGTTLPHRQLTCPQVSAHVSRVHCCDDANGVAFLHVHSTFTFCSALEFISAFIFPLFLSVFWCLHSLSSFFPLCLLSFSLLISFGPLHALSEPVVSSLERCSPLPEGRSRSLRSNRSFGGSSVTVVKMTPLSFLPGTRIIKYLGIINMFFIRETTSLREVRLQKQATNVQAP